jgi:hypothetical protein
VLEPESKARADLALGTPSLSSTVLSCRGMATSILAKDNVLRRPGFRFAVSFVVFVDEDRISGDLSLNGVATFPCPSLLLPSSSTFGRLEADGRGRVEGSSVGMSS